MMRNIFQLPLRNRGRREVRGMKKIMEKAKKWKIREFLGEVLDWIIYLSGKSWFQALVAVVLVGWAVGIWLFVRILSMLHM